MSDDVIVLARRDPETERTSVVRLREGRVEVGTVQPLVHGQPIQGEVVRLKPRKELPMVCDVDVVLSADELGPARDRAGPAQVATERYRQNWDAIWAPADDELPS